MTNGMTMTKTSRRRFRVAAPALAALLLAACGGETDSAPNDLVFGDDYGPGVRFEAFSGVPGSATVTIDTAEKYLGGASLKIMVPDTSFAGGAFPTSTARDLSAYDALTFWAKASKAATLNVAGIGVDNQPDPPFIAERTAIPLTTTWTKFVLPIPLAAKLASEDGLFHFAEGSDEGAYTIWLDEVRFETLGAAALGTPAPAIATETVTKEVGATHAVNGASVTFPGGGALGTQNANVTISASRRYFTWNSSNTMAATVDPAGVVTAVGVGSTEITAMLGSVAAAGTTTVNVVLPVAPASPAPAPTFAAADVIALFSGAYPTNVPVDTWSAVWDSADVEDATVGADAVKKYTNLVFAGIEFTSATIDATAMTHFHLQLWTPDATEFKVKLVDFGADGAFGGGDDTEHELTFDAATTPALVNAQWVTLDIPLADFVNMTSRAHVAQLILVATNSTVYVDDVLFHR